MVALCYHSIADRGPAWTSVPPDMFERQLALLRRRGYASAGGATIEGLAGGQRSDGPLALLTFDDGYLDNHAVAFPLLRSYGFTGIFFLLPPFVDERRPLAWDEVEDRVDAHPDVMRSVGWPEVEEMADGGCEFGSHGLHHRHLPELSDEELCEELLDSRRRIKDRVGRCDLLAYPFGEWSSRVASAAERTGYSFAFTLPRAHQPEVTRWSVPRIAVDHRDAERRFALKLHPVARRLYLSRAKARLRGA